MNSDKGLPCPPKENHDPLPDPRKVIESRTHSQKVQDMRTQENDAEQPPKMGATATFDGAVD